MAKGEATRMTRTCITGGPKTGKTTLAKEMVRVEPVEHLVWGVNARSTDDLIHLGWSEASQHVADEWLTQPGPWIIEGVAVSRALRKWREAHPGEAPPVDRVIYLTETFKEPTAGQRAMAKGVETVHREIEGWLSEHGVRTEFLVERELRCEHPGYNGIAKLE